MCVYLFIISDYFSFSFPSFHFIISFLLRLTENDKWTTFSFFCFIPIFLISNPSKKLENLSFLFYLTLKPPNIYKLFSRSRINWKSNHFHFFASVSFVHFSALKLFIGISFLRTIFLCKRKEKNVGQFRSSTSSTHFDSMLPTQIPLYANFSLNILFCN